MNVATHRADESTKQMEHLHLVLWLLNDCVKMAQQQVKPTELNVSRLND